MLVFFYPGYGYVGAIFMESYSWLTEERRTSLESPSIPAKGKLYLVYLWADGDLLTNLETCQLTGIKLETSLPEYRRMLREDGTLRETMVRDGARGRRVYRIIKKEEAQ